MIHKLTYSDKFRSFYIYNHGCNINCPSCSYRLKKTKENEKIDSYLSVDEIKQTLRKLDIDKVHFIGGEPTTYTSLGEIADFVKNELGLYTKIGHSNGFNVPPDNIDAMSISIKTHSAKLHVEYAGVSNACVLENFAETYRRGVKVDASTVFVPQIIECGEIEKVAKFVAEIDPNIPYHIVGYVPVPNSPWRKAMPQEVKEAEKVAQKYLTNVSSSCLSVDDFFNLYTKDVRYKSVRVA